MDDGERVVRIMAVCCAGSHWMTAIIANFCDFFGYELFYDKEEWCPGAESNHRHEDFQSTALPLSYPGMDGVRTESAPFRLRPRYCLYRIEFDEHACAGNAMR